MTAADNEQPIEFPSDRVPQVADLVQSRSPSSVLTCVRDFDGYTVSINPAYQAALGWSVEELSSVPYWELLHPDDQDQSVEVRQWMLLSGPGCVFGHKLRMLCGDGTYRCTQWDIWSNSEEQRMYLVGMDITDYEPLVTDKRVLVGSWDWHIPTNTATWSDGMFEVYGLPPGETRNLETALQRRYVDDRTAVEQSIRRSLTTAEPYTADHRIVHPDGRIRWLHSAGRVFLDKDGDPQRMRGLTWDATERPGSRVPG